MNGRSGLRAPGWAAGSVVEATGAPCATPGPRLSASAMSPMVVIPPAGPTGTFAVPGAVGAPAAAPSGFGECGSIRFGAAEVSGIAAGRGNPAACGGGTGGADTALASTGLG